MGVILTINVADDELPVQAVARDPNRIRSEEIRKAVCRRFFITQNELVGSRRSRRVCWPRMLAMALTRDLTTHSLPKIGMSFGGRDHTTVLSAVRRMDVIRAENPDWAQHYEVLKAELVWRQRVSLPSPANDGSSE